MTDDLNSLCPCGSQQDYHQCCQPLLSRTQTADSAKTLMRSRFTANVVGDLDYLKHTWWPGNCPELDPNPEIRWLALDVAPTAIPSSLPSVLTDNELVDLNLAQLTPSQYRLAWVSFTAIFQESSNGSRSFGQLTETSRFIWLASESAQRSPEWCDRWLYLDGDADWNTVQPARNQICLCGSGAKFKRCCGG